MGLGTGATAAIIGGISAAGSVASSAIAAHGAKSAANTQAKAAQSAEQVQQQEMQPYLDAGTSALSKLSGVPDFAAPTAAEARDTPGYQFAVDQGMKALNGNLIARGVSGGNAAEAIQKYGQGLADSNYNDTYNRALKTYDTNTGRLQQIAGMGENAAQNFANNQSNLITGAGNAQAAGQVGSANAISSGISGIGGSITNGLLLQQLLNPGATNATSYSQPASAITDPFGNPLPTPPQYSENFS